jgi:hypothetical protein
MTKARTLADNYAADISGITAGTGITGGGTSGTVTITNDMATTIAAKGDLIIGTGNDTYNRLAVASTAGWLLSVDSAETTGLKWAAPAASGGMTSIASANLPTNTNTVTLSTISGSYVDLVLYIRDYYFAADDYMCIRVNSDTGSNYGWTGVWQSAENTASVSCDGIRDRLFTNGDDAKENADKNIFSAVYFPDYANTTHKKLIDIRSVARDQTDAYETQFQTNGNFNGSAAITSITLFTQNGSNFSGGSYELYGVK